MKPHLPKAPSLHRLPPTAQPTLRPWNLPFRL